MNKHPENELTGYVAVYGSLMREAGMQRMLNIEDKLRFIEPCQIPGKLYDLGEYPGLVEGDEIVPSELYEVLDGSAFTVLDDYEDCHPNHPEVSLFYRRVVRLHSPAVDCWIYFYNRAITGKVCISGMSWPEFKAKKTFNSSSRRGTKSNGTTIQ